MSIDSKTLLMATLLKPLCYKDQESGGKEVLETRRQGMIGGSFHQLPSLCYLFKAWKLSSNPKGRLLGSGTVGSVPAVGSWDSSHTGDMGADTRTLGGL